MRAFHLCISVIPAAVVGLIGFVALAMLYNGDLAAERTRIVLVSAAVGTAITLGAAVFAADAATRRVHRQQVPAVQATPAVPPAIPVAAHDGGELRRRLGELGFLIARGRQELQELLERLGNGDAVAPRPVGPAAPDTGDPVMQLAQELRRAQGEAWNAVLGLASRKTADAADQRVDVFVNLARRMQSLSHRAIQGLDELENQVEDPDLLKGLFRVDHLSTRMRRQAESLAVIGGAASRRQWSRPVTVYEVLRSAIAEVEHYNRVKVVPPVDGTLHGRAVADVIHLLAELIENATKFAPPQTQVLVRVENVTAGLAIEVEDRGLGIPRDSQRHLNELLASHAGVDTGELLQDGRIGLLVVSALARRHNVGVQLQTNLFGGTQAVVVVPGELIGAEVEESEPQQRTPPAEPAPAMAASASVSGPQPVTAQAGSGPGGDAGPDPMRSDRDAADARPSTGAYDGRHYTVPARHTDSRGASPDAGHGSSWQAPPASGDPAPYGGRQQRGDPAPGAGERPPLPRRRVQASLAPELVNAPAFAQDDQDVEHNSGLMAAFQRGVRSGQQNEGAADDTDSTG